MDESSAELIGAVIGGLIGLLAGIVIEVFFILTLRKALLRCSIENRSMSPNLVWLLLVPIFHFIWNFFVVINLANSLHSEFRKRGISTEPFPGKSIGLAYSILSTMQIIPLIGLFIAIPALICFIVYWIKISEYSNKLSIEQTALPAGSH